MKIKIVRDAGFSLKRSGIRTALPVPGAEAVLHAG